MTNAQFLRGQVVLAGFPTFERPDAPAAKLHFCLVVDTVDLGQERLIAVAYGTSKLDEELLETHSGAVLSIPTSHIKIGRGFMSGEVAHFVLSHVALIPQEWIDTSFAARFDFMRPEARQNDPIRRRLYNAFVAAEPIMQSAALQAARHTEQTGCLGLPPGKLLRRPPRP